MKILNLKAENIKKLVAVDITPDADTVIITGKNGAGKSSVLDSIFWALGGTKNIQEKPIRDGQETAFVKLDLGRLKVERTFTAKGTYLKVTAEDGAKYGNGQEMLNKLLGSITFDPLEFSRMHWKDQFDALRRLVAPDVDIEALDRGNKADYDQRTSVNRDVEQAKAVVAQLEQETAGDAPESVDVMELVKQINDAKDSARDFAENENLISDHQDLIASLDQEIAHYQEKIKAVEGRKANAQTQLDGAKEAREKWPAPVDIAPLEEKLQNAQATNAKAQAFDAAKKRLEEQRAVLKTKTELSETLTANIEKRKKQKEEAIAAVKMPIEGLSLQDGAVIFNGIPFAQASSAEQLRVSTAIAMAMNPELRVIRIKDGSLLDREGLEMVKEMAKDGDFQIWLEAVESDDPVAIVIEDGTVRGITATEATNQLHSGEEKPPAKPRKGEQGALI